MVPAKVCFMWFIDDPSYLPCDKDYVMRVTRLEARNANAMFVAADFGEPSAELRKYDLLQVRTTRNISSGDENCIDYGNNYTFSSNLNKWVSLVV